MMTLAVILCLVASPCFASEVLDKSLKASEAKQNVGTGRGIPYKWIQSDYNNYLFWNESPYAFLNFTDTQSQAVAALGNAAVFLGSLLVLGNLPASSVLGKRVDHRFGLPAGFPHERRRRPTNPHRSGRPSSREVSRRKRPYGMRRLKKKSGQALREFTYRKRPSKILVVCAFG